MPVRVAPEMRNTGPFQRSRRTISRQRFSAAWLVIGLVTFGLASHQRGDLVAPLMPAGAMLAALTVVPGRARPALAQMIPSTLQTIPVDTPVPPTEPPTQAPTAPPAEPTRVPESQEDQEGGDRSGQPPAPVVEPTIEGVEPTRTRRPTRTPRTTATASPTPLVAGGLRLDLRVPPRVHQEHVVRRGEGDILAHLAGHLAGARDSHAEQAAHRRALGVQVGPSLVVDDSLVIFHIAVHDQPAQIAPRHARIVRRPRSGDGDRLSWSHLRPAELWIRGDQALSIGAFGFDVCPAERFFQGKEVA